MTRDQIIKFLCLFNPALYYSIASYLIGSNYPRYFLFEYYKAMEFIENELGSEGKLISSLKPYGVTGKKYKAFKRLCNYHPVDISRHAPKKGVPFYAIDIRNLLAEPKSKQVFESAALSCRAVIDAYHQYLKTGVTQWR